MRIIGPQPIEAKVSTAAVDDDAITLAKMAGGTDGQIITYDASGDPVAVGPGTDGQVLTSTGSGSPPAFEAASAGATTQVKTIYKTFDVSTSTGTFAVTGVGVEPQFVFILAAEHETLVQSWGFGTTGGGSKINAVNWRKADADGISGVTTEIAYYWPNGSHRVLIDIDSMDSDGATFGNLKVGSPTGNFIMYMFFLRFAAD